MLGCSTNNEETLPRVLLSGSVAPGVPATGFSNDQGGDVVLKILVGVGLGFLLFTNPEARQITADLLRSTANAIAPEQDGKTFQDRVKDAVVEKVMEEQ